MFWHFNMTPINSPLQNIYVYKEAQMGPNGSLEHQLQHF